MDLCENQVPQAWLFSKPQSDLITFLPKLYNYSLLFKVSSIFLQKLGPCLQKMVWSCCFYHGKIYFSPSAFHRASVLSVRSLHHECVSCISLLSTSFHTRTLPLPQTRRSGGLELCHSISSFSLELDWKYQASGDITDCWLVPKAGLVISLAGPWMLIR